MTHYEMIFKLFFALILGFFIGLDRQLKHKPLGMKTSMIISVASCLITIVSIQSFLTYATPTFRNMDPMRLTAQIVSGVGFLGAGVILRRTNDVISGLTSAALIWSASGLGIAVGVGLYLEATFAVILFILSVNVLPFIVKRFGPKRLREREIAVQIIMNPNSKMTELLQSIEGQTTSLAGNMSKDLTVRKMRIQDIENGQQKINLVLSAPEDEYTTEIYYMFKKIDDVIGVKIERL